MTVPVQAWAVVVLPAWPVVTVPDCEALSGSGEGPRLHVC